MAFDKNGASGSSEELDAYGVWVKSEPQDMVSGLNDAVGFGGGAVPFDSDFNAAFDDIGISGLGISDFDGEASPVNIDDFQINSFGDDNSMGEDNGLPQEVSAQLLLKIADEISSIRDELTTLKREFADIRAENGFPAESGVLFGEETESDDEKIALTGDEMDNILSSAGFSEEDAAYDALREEEAAALRKLSEQNEAEGQEDTPAEGEGTAEETEEPEEEIIDIDFDELGIDLDDELAGRVGEAPAPETAAPPEIDPADELANIEAAAEAQAAAQEYDLSLAEGFLLDSIDEINEMRDLKLDGAAPLSPAPADTSYLDAYPFALENPVFDEPFPGETNININVDLGDVALRLDEASLEESGGSPEDDPFSLDEASLGIDAAALGLEDFSIESPALVDEFESMDLSDAVIEDPDISAGLSEPVLEEPNLGDISLDMSDIGDFAQAAGLDSKDDSLAQVIPEGFELGTAEEAAPLDDDLETLADDVGITVDIDDLALSAGDTAISPDMQGDLKNMLSYMDHLLESLPEEKIEEFAKSEYFDTYKKIFKELGLV